jgi:hypothetical protein
MDCEWLVTFHMKPIQFYHNIYAEMALQLRCPVRTSRMSLSGRRVAITPDHHMMRATFVKSVRSRW